MAGFEVDVKNENSKIINVIRMAAVYLSLLSFSHVYFSSFKITVNYFQLAVILLPIVILSYFMLYIPKYFGIRMISLCGVLAVILWGRRESVMKGIDELIKPLH